MEVQSLLAKVRGSMFSLLVSSIASPRAEVLAHGEPRAKHEAEVRGDHDQNGYLITRELGHDHQVWRKLLMVNREMHEEYYGWTYNPPRTFW